MTPEGRVKANIKELFKSIGAYYYMSVPVGYGKQTLDFLVCYKGKFYGVEAKRPEGAGRVTPRQHSIMEEIAEAGGGVCVEDRLDCANVKRMLGLCGVCGRPLIPLSECALNDLAMDCGGTCYACISETEK